MAEQVPPTTEKPKNGLTPLFAVIKAWPLSRKIAAAAVIAITVGLFAFIIVQARSIDYQLLYGNLAESDASAMIEWLKGQNLPYQLTNNGRNILIPTKDVYETRLALASAGLPQGGGIGFEIFDKQSFALTDFSQKVNYLRALQGELARTIRSLGPVEMARVHLALPEKRLFKDQQKPVTASITLTLVPGKRLSEPQIEGIVHLVASAIDSLDPDKVTVVDQDGNVLTAVGNKNAFGRHSPDMLEFQSMVEQRLETRAQALLDKALGADSAMVRVTATLDFSQTEKTEESFDPEEPVIRSEQLSEERTGSDIVGGVPGVQSNLEGASSQTGITAPSSKSQRVTNYEISKVVSRTTLPIGAVTKLSVAVLVADAIIPAEGNLPERSEARSPEELKSLATMISSALGLDPSRGDKIEVTSLPFTTATGAAEAQEAPTTLERMQSFTPFFRYALLFLGGVFLYFLLIRPLLRILNRDVTAHYKTVAEMEAEQTGGASAEGQYSQDPFAQLQSKSVNDPVFTAHILKDWIRHP